MAGGRPCCVFWKDPRNTFRRTPAGKLVKTYEQLCEYMSTRVPGIRETSLRFHGQNRVFFWHPPPGDAVPEEPNLEPRKCWQPADVCSPCDLVIGDFPQSIG